MRVRREAQGDSSLTLGMTGIEWVIEKERRFAQRIASPSL